MKKISLVALLIVTITILVLLKQNPGNTAATSPNHEDERLRTRKYTAKISLNDYCHRIAEIIKQLKTYGKKWKLVSKECNMAETESMNIKAEVPVFFYIDDLEVKIRPGGNFVLVDVYSESRVGKNDLGENKRHILKLLKVLDKEFKPE